MSFEITKYSKHDRNHGIGFHILYDTDTVIEMVNSFVWDGSDLFNGSVAVVEAAIAEPFLKFLHLVKTLHQEGTRRHEVSLLPEYRQ